MNDTKVSPVPGHIRTALGNERNFCSREGQMAPGGQCPDGCDHADHYSNDGHPECEDAPQFCEAYNTVRQGMCQTPLTPHGDCSRVLEHGDHLADR